MTDFDISVLLATNDPGASVELCLESLSRQTDIARAEVIVADCSTDGTADLIRARFPWVKLLAHDRPVGLPELMKEAMQQAQGKVLAVTDAYCVFPPDWVQKLIRAHQSDYPVIGGAVENGRPDRLLSWACFFADYSAFMLPSPRGVTSLLAGNHVSYKSWVIKDALDSMQDGFRKVFFHWGLERRGMQFFFEPHLVIYYGRPNTIGGFMRGYHQHGWFFGALRTKGMSPVERWLRLLTTPILPAGLLWQRIRPALGKKRHREKLLLSIPLLILFVTAWAAGEFKGYLLGPARLPKDAFR